MGLDVNGIRFLLYAQKLGVDFTRTAMIGRQRLHLRKLDLKDSFRVFGYEVKKELIDHIFDREDRYAEPLLRYLGAKDVHSFDFSAYEGATHLFDMNKEIPAALKNHYSIVLDGGSLEHVFNFPVAIRNCMEMVRVGGHYLGITPVNNFMGHGFYQFSPELYFSVFTRKNGFELISLIAFEDVPRARWYSVRSPKEVRGRVTLVNNVPVYLLIVAKKLKKAIIFESIPQQSDYLTVWRQNDTTSSYGVSPPMKRISRFCCLKKNIPRPMKRLFERFARKTSFGFNTRFFQRLDPTATVKSPNNPV